MTQAKQVEPPSWSRPPLFMIGRDDRGNWVVQDLRVCPGTSNGITKFSEHEAD